MLWRVIPYSINTAAWNMAVDDAILTAFCNEASPATVRFYGWQTAAVSIGRLQPVSSVPKGWGREIVRRPTGGRAVLHGEDLTFSIVVSASILGSPIAQSYKRTATAIAEALTSLGVPAEMCRNTTPPQTVRGIGNCFDLTLDYELAVYGKKVLGSAQVRRSGAVLQQNSLILPSECPQPDREMLIAAITEALAAEFDAGIFYDELSSSELQIARKLADNNYVDVELAGLHA